MILVLGTYFFPVNVLSKQKCKMRRVIRKLHGSKVRRYVAHLVDIHEYLVVFPGTNISNKVCVMELNEKVLNSMPNIWSKQAHVK